MSSSSDFQLIDSSNERISSILGNSEETTHTAQNDSFSPANKNPNEGLSRRDFLRKGLVTAGTLVAVPTAVAFAWEAANRHNNQTSNLETPTTPTPPLLEDENINPLEAKGLQVLIPCSESMEKAWDDYAIHFTNLPFIDAVTHEAASSASTSLFENWGIGDTAQSANPPKLIPRDIDDTQLDIAKRVVSYVDATTPKTMKSATEIEFYKSEPGGGNAAPNGHINIGLNNEALLPTNYLSLLHEVQHTFDSRVFDIRENLSLEKVTEYYKTVIDGAYATLEDFTKAETLDELINTKTAGIPLFEPNVWGKEMGKRMATLAAQIYERKLIHTIPNEIHQDGAYWYYKNIPPETIILNLGIRDVLREIKTNKQGQSLYLRNDPEVRELLDAVVDELVHYFVGPNMPARERITGTENFDQVFNLALQGNKLNEENYKIQRARLAISHQNSFRALRAMWKFYLDPSFDIISYLNPQHS